MTGAKVEATPTFLVIWAASLLHAASQAENAGRAAADIATPRWRVLSLLNWSR